MNNYHMPSVCQHVKQMEYMCCSVSRDGLSSRDIGHLCRHECVHRQLGNNSSRLHRLTNTITVSNEERRPRGSNHDAIG